MTRASESRDPWDWAEQAVVDYESSEGIDAVGRDELRRILHDAFRDLAALSQPPDDRTEALRLLHNKGCPSIEAGIVVGNCCEVNDRALARLDAAKPAEDEPCTVCGGGHYMNRHDPMGAMRGHQKGCPAGPEHFKPEPAEDATKCPSCGITITGTSCPKCRRPVMPYDAPQEQEPDAATVERVERAIDKAWLEHPLSVPHAARAAIEALKGAPQEQDNG